MKKGLFRIFQTSFKTVNFILNNFSWVKNNEYYFKCLNQVFHLFINMSTLSLHEKRESKVEFLAIFHGKNRLTIATRLGSGAMLFPFCNCESLVNLDN